jgi:DNA-binding MarR family transcriptional regulator
MDMADRKTPTTLGDGRAQPFDDFVEAVLDLMRTVRRTGGAAHTLRGGGISVPQLVVLGAVDSAGERGVSAVADDAGLAQPTVTRALSALERRDLVRRAPHASDGRTASLALTAAGQSVLQDKRNEIAGRFAALWETLEESQRDHAVHLVRRLSEITGELT